jgi:hypothetical protein
VKTRTMAMTTAKCPSAAGHDLSVVSAFAPSAQLVGLLVLLPLRRQRQHSWCCCWTRKGWVFSAVGLLL